ncbi:hypothetical protein MLD38_009923 [Melastoma candidum]|uniref:Uncharacterized protein n=1 Tax=Melastoma candidum TaxID=119954 RepID=A0ACB9QYD0_9MYRT|nr:hypothetical protein MLD38_009923 [Melastoma candidum]
MSNSSLDKWIFAEFERRHLPAWEKRRNTVLDVVRGLHYLHKECHQKIVHYDIKPQNILLDEDFLAKVTDFGLSNTIDGDQSRVMTVLREISGYLAPERLKSAITKKGRSSEGPKKGSQLLETMDEIWDVQHLKRNTKEAGLTLQKGNALD